MSPIQDLEAKKRRKTQKKEGARKLPLLLMISSCLILWWVTAASQTIWLSSTQGNNEFRETINANNWQSSFSASHQGYEGTTLEFFSRYKTENKTTIVFQ